ncbi:transferring glycosyl group transferase [Actinidia rufa]|uniref:Transferring glycosyl group transferase n=1 Tax=Actinidia rufa TaxID=165716 RepID=A0A7J0H090_9ERIC|nr:transferring glycosyl group transferase [Actinidia rufa]
MKATQKDFGRAHRGSWARRPRVVPKLMLWLVLFVSVTYTMYTLKLFSSASASSYCDDDPLFIPTTDNRLTLPSNTTSEPPPPIRAQPGPTDLSHVVFGIAGSARKWDHRKDYIKVWWRKGMRGGRLARRPGQNPTRRAPPRNPCLRRYNPILLLEPAGYPDSRSGSLGSCPKRFGSRSPNIYFSYSMAFGGGGFAISYPLARALEKMQDRCIQRYPGLFASDDRMQACMAELGVPLTKELGFHQVCISAFLCVFF